MKTQKAKKENCQIPKQAIYNDEVNNDKNVVTKKDKINDLFFACESEISIQGKYKNLVFFALCEFRKTANNAFLDFLKVDKSEISLLISQIDEV